MTPAAIIDETELLDQQTLLELHIRRNQDYLSQLRDTYKDERGLIIQLVDDDLKQMLDGYSQTGEKVWEELFQTRYHYIALA